MVAVVILDTMQCEVLTQQELAARVAEGWTVLHSQWGQATSADVWRVLPPPPKQKQELWYD